MAGVRDRRSGSGMQDASGEARELEQMTSDFESAYEDAHEAFVRDFRTNAVRLVRESDASTSDVALALGIPPITLEDWVEEDQKILDDATESDALGLADLREQLAKMRQENARLRSGNARLRLQFPSAGGDQ
jgi:transposase-like protein